MLSFIYKDFKNKDLLVLFSVYHGKRIDSLHEQLGFSITCTLVTLEMLTGTDIKGYRLCYTDADNSRGHNACNK